MEKGAIIDRIKSFQFKVSSKQLGLDFQKQVSSIQLPVLSIDNNNNSSWSSGELTLTDDVVGISFNTVKNMIANNGRFDLQVDILNKNNQPIRSYNFLGCNVINVWDSVLSYSDLEAKAITVEFSFSDPRVLGIYTKTED